MVTAVQSRMAAAMPLADHSTNTAEHDWITGVLEMLSTASVAHTVRDTLLVAGSAAQSSFFGVLGAFAVHDAFHRCQQDGWFSSDALLGLGAGVSAAISFDRLATTLGGAGVGIARFGGATAALTIFARCAVSVQRGDIPMVMRSGARLVAMLALSGHPVALGVIVWADVAYSLACASSSTAASGKQDPETPVRDVEIKDVEDPEDREAAGSDVSAIAGGGEPVETDRSIGNASPTVVEPPVDPRENASLFDGGERVVGTEPSPTGLSLTGA